MLTNPYLIALGIPLILLICGALAKKLVRGGGWKYTDFFLGVEISLAALGSEMVYLYDLQKLSVTPAVEISRPEKIIATTSIIVITFFLLLCVLSIHQDWEGRTQNWKGQIVWLGGFCNGIGIALFAAFVMIVKGV